MNKKLQFKSLLLLAVMLFGASSAWAADKWVKTDFADLATDDIVVIADANTQSTKALSNDGGTNNAPSVVNINFNDDQTEITSTVDKKIQWVVTLDEAGVKFGVSGTETFLYCINNNNGVRVGTNTNNIFTIKEGYLYNNGQSRYLGVYNNQDWRCYTTIHDNIKSTEIAFFKKIADASGTPTCESPTFSPAAGLYTSAQNVEINTTTEGATIYYTIDGSEPTTSSSTYTSTISVSGTITIKAIATKASYDNSDIVSATYGLVEHVGTETDPYTASDARTAIDVNAGIENVYAKGIVSKIVTAYSEEHSNVSFNISADGSENGDQLEAYRCKGATGVDASDVKVGDVVLIKGTLTKYGSTYEFGQGCELISLQHPVTPIIAATPASLTEFTYEVGKGPSEAKTFSVTGENLTGNITLSLGESSNYEMSLTENNGYGNSLTITQSEGAVEATTVYVRLKADLVEGTYEDGTITLTTTGATDKTVSLTGSVTAPEAPNVTWDLKIASYEEITDEDVVTWSNEYATMTNSSKGGGTKASNYLGEDANHRTSSRFYTNNTLTVTPANGYTITSIEFSATSDSYASSLASSTWSNASAEANEKTVTVTPTDGTKTISAIIGGTCGFTAVKVYYEESSSVVENVTVTITTDKYTTFSSPYAVDFSEADVTVYKAKVNDGVVVLSPISNSIVPANTGVILFAETANDYTGKVTTGGSVSDNELVAATTETKVVYKNSNKFNYILQGGVFKKATGDKLKAGKAYLNTTYDVTASADGARELKIVVEGEATAIKALETAADKNVYDLQGRKVAAPTKGLYIINGKKMIVK